MMFFTFAFTFLTMKDDDRSISYVAWTECLKLEAVTRGVKSFTFCTPELDPKLPEVLLNLYQALSLTDSDGAEGISGIDIGHHQQTADFGFEMYTGGGKMWLLPATTLCMLFATSIFSLVLLSHGRIKKYNI